LDLVALTMDRICPDVLEIPDRARPACLPCPNVPIRPLNSSPGRRRLPLRPSASSARYRISCAPN
jgi:hypothetical protein